MFDTRSDEERAVPPKAVKVKKPVKVCNHQFGDWMTDVITVKTPTGKVYLPAPLGAFRRFCKRCKLEQKGSGSDYGFNIKVVEIG